MATRVKSLKLATVSHSPSRKPTGRAAVDGKGPQHGAVVTQDRHRGARPQPVPGGFRDLGRSSGGTRVPPEPGLHGASRSNCASSRPMTRPYSRCRSSVDCVERVQVPPRTHILGFQPKISRHKGIRTSPSAFGAHTRRPNHRLKCSPGHQSSPPAGNRYGWRGSGVTAGGCTCPTGSTLARPGGSRPVCRRLWSTARTRSLAARPSPRTAEGA